MPAAGGLAPQAGAARPLVVMVINEAWFFRSHFRGWAEAAAGNGFEVTVLTRPDGGPEAMAGGLVRLADGGAARGGLRPKGLVRAARALAARVQAGHVPAGGEQAGRPVIVHAVGLHGLAIVALARLRGLKVPVAVSLTGLGFLASAAAPARLAGLAAASVMRRLVDGPQTLWLVENDHDAARIGLGRAAAEGRCIRLTGVGVDPAAFPVEPMPSVPPLKLILVARMIRSKGIDLAVAALSEARAKGIDARLTLVGEPDADNPHSHTAIELDSFAGREGVDWLGRRDDVAALLAGHHAFILPSRGGEGLPRALLEAAAAGRPAIVTDVPGCRDFVSDGATGLVVPPENVGALAGAIGAMAAADPAAMGARARARLVATGTAAEVCATVVESYRRLVLSQGEVGEGLSSCKEPSKRG